jgi:hypothetical protein
MYMMFMSRNENSLIREMWHNNLRAFLERFTFANRFFFSIVKFTEHKSRSNSTDKSSQDSNRNRGV